MSGREQLKLVICQGPSCSLMGSADLVVWCQDLENAGLAVSHQISGCTGYCLESPVVQWNGRFLTCCSPEKLTSQLIQEDDLL